MPFFPEGGGGGLKFREELGYLYLEHRFKRQLVFMTIHKAK